MNIRYKIFKMNAKKIKLIFNLISKTKKGGRINLPPFFI